MTQKKKKNLKVKPLDNQTTKQYNTIKQTKERQGMKMTTIKANGRINAVQILEDSGYIRNWTKSGSYWTKNGEEFEYMGWGPSIEGMMPIRPDYIELEKVK